MEQSHSAVVSQYLSMNVEVVNNGVFKSESAVGLMYKQSLVSPFFLTLLFKKVSLFLGEKTTILKIKTAECFYHLSFPFIFFSFYFLFSVLNSKRISHCPPWYLRSSDRMFFGYISVVPEQSLPC